MSVKARYGQKRKSSLMYGWHLKTICKHIKCNDNETLIKAIIIGNHTDYWTHNIEAQKDEQRAKMYCRIAHVRSYIQIHTYVSRYMAWHVLLTPAFYADVDVLDFEWHINDIYCWCLLFLLLLLLFWANSFASYLYIYIPISSVCNNYSVYYILQWSGKKILMINRQQHNTITQKIVTFSPSNNHVFNQQQTNKK